MTDEKTEELPVREPEASFVDNPAPTTSEYAGVAENLEDTDEVTDEVTDYGDGGPVSDERLSHGHDPSVPHVHILGVPGGLKLGDLFGGLLDGILGKPKSELQKELEEVFPDATVHVHVKTSWGKEYKADINVPLQYQLNSGAHNAYINHLQLQSLLAAVIEKVDSELKLEAIRLGSIAEVDLRCHETGGLSSTYNSIVEKHANKATEQDAENQASADNAGAQ